MHHDMTQRFEANMTIYVFGIGKPKWDCFVTFSTLGFIALSMKHSSAHIWWHDNFMQRKINLHNGCSGKMTNEHSAHTHFHLLWFMPHFCLLIGSFYWILHKNFMTVYCPPLRIIPDFVTFRTCFDYLSFTSDTILPTFLIWRMSQFQT